MLRIRALLATMLAIAILSLAACSSGSSAGTTSEEPQPRPQTTTAVPSSTEPPTTTLATTPEAQSTPQSDGQIQRQSEPGAAPQSEVGQKQPDDQFGYTVEKYISYITTDVDKMWSTYFAQSGLQEPEVYIHVIPEDSQGQVIEGCFNNQPVKPDAPNAWYCNSNVTTDSNGKVWQGGVIFPITTMQGMWTGRMFNDQTWSQTRGDFAAAIIIAHEFGHHIADELELQYEALGYDIIDLANPYVENIADCYAGIWMAHAYSTGVLTDTDYYEAISALQSIGDPNVNTRDHGTSEQRVEALLVGYNSGDGTTVDPSACNSKYWLAA